MNPESFIQGEEGDVHPEEQRTKGLEANTCIPMNMEHNLLHQKTVYF